MIWLASCNPLWKTLLTGAMAPRVFLPAQPRGDTR